MRTFLVRVALCCALAWPVAAQAHDVRGTLIFVDLGRTRAHLEVQVPVEELRQALGAGRQLGEAALPASEAELDSYVLAHLSVRTPEAQAFTLAVQPGGVIHRDARSWLVVQVDALPPRGGSSRDFVLESDVVVHRVVSHDIYVFLRHDVETGLVDEAPSLLATLHYQAHLVHIERPPGSWGVGLWAVFRLGMFHIAEGSDHLLFLFTLLLPAGLSVAGRRRWGARRPARAAAFATLRIVSAFTLGHSATLLLGALGLARLPNALVESLIAISILVSAAHAVTPLFPRREAWVALAFGLVHGLGFASALEGIGVDGGTLLLTVLGFNLGVEVVQAALVLVALPWVFVLQGTRWEAPLRRGGAGLAIVMATAWLAQRALGFETPLTRLMDSSWRMGPWLLGALAGTALAAWRWEHPGARPFRSDPG